MITKFVDSKGRVTLGSRFAGRMVLIDDSDPDRIVIVPAVAIPEREAWLNRNEVALNLVREGLADAKEARFVDEPPDVAADTAASDEFDIPLRTRVKS